MPNRANAPIKLNRIWSLLCFENREKISAQMIRSTQETINAPAVCNTRSCWLSPLPDQIFIKTIAKKAEITIAGHQRGFVSTGLSSMGSCSVVSCSDSSISDRAMVYHSGEIEPDENYLGSNTGY